MASRSKFKELTDEQVEYINSNLIQYTTIPAGTKLYRAGGGICRYSKNIDKLKQKCTDTGRHGLYFSTYLFQSLAMSLEYNKDLELGVFITSVDIPVIIGKYSYRYLNPRRYFHWNVVDDVMEVKLHVSPTKDEEISHFDNNIYPIVNFESLNGKKHIEYNMDKFADKLKPLDGEIFITDDHVLKNISMIKTYKIDLSKLKEFVADHIHDLDPYNYTTYRSVLSILTCSKAGGSSRRMRSRRQRAVTKKRTVHRSA
jgi:hypothetical protein